MRPLGGSSSSSSSDASNGGGGIRSSHGRSKDRRAAKQAGKPKAPQFMAFDKAVMFARGLKLRTAKEWETWRKSGARPADMPSSPQRTYRYCCETLLGGSHGRRRGGGQRFAAGAAVQYS